jgi:hypothetical protein
MALAGGQKISGVGNLAVYYSGPGDGDSTAVLSGRYIFDINVGNAMTSATSIPAARDIVRSLSTPLIQHLNGTHS